MKEKRKKKMEIEVGKLHEMECELRALRERNRILREAVLELSRRGTDCISINSDILLPARDLSLILDMAAGADDMETLIYGNPVTVHWRGFYCDCGDGAYEHMCITSALVEIADEQEA